MKNTPISIRRKKRRSTDASRAASRTNGANSHGPKSVTGKSVSALNAVTHGLSARTLVLGNEEPAALDHLRALYAHRFPPTSPAEADLLEQVIAARWRLRRHWTAETALFDAEMIRQRARVQHEWPNLDEPLRFALAFEALADDHHSLDTLSPGQARLFREHHIARHPILPNEPKSTIQLPPSAPLSPSLAKQTQRLANLFLRT